MNFIGQIFSQMLPAFLDWTLGKAKNAYYSVLDFFKIRKEQKKREKLADDITKLAQKARELRKKNLPVPPEDEKEMREKLRELLRSSDNN